MMFPVTAFCLGYRPHGPGLAQGLCLDCRPNGPGPAQGFCLGYRLHDPAPILGRLIKSSIRSNRQAHIFKVT